MNAAQLDEIRAVEAILGDGPEIFRDGEYFPQMMADKAETYIKEHADESFFMYFALNIGTYTYFGQAFICLVKDIPTAGALVGALIGYNVFFSGLVVRPQYFSGPFQLGYWSAPGRFAFEGIVTSQFKDLDYTVVAEPFTPWWFDIGCNEAEPGEACTGSIEEYVDFFFGGRFKDRYQPLDIGVLVFCLLLARLMLWAALWKFNYVNT